MTANERERAQLERAETTEETETALVFVEVVARDDQGRITQFRKFREPTPKEARAFLRRKGGDRP